MLRAELLRIMRRRGSYWTACLLGLAAVATMIVVRLSQNAEPGGTDLLDAMDPISTPALLMAVIVAALAGSYDVAQGTMRYLVMTGVPRSRIYATRVAGTAIATALCCLPAIALALVAAYVCDHPSRHDPTLQADLGAVWAYLANPLAFALVSLAVGTLLHSNGGAIGVALGLSLGGAIVTGLVSAYVSETLAAYLLPAAADIAAQFNHGEAISVPAAFAALAAWIVAFLGAGLWRMERDEY
jgi:ABC-type transport system involved in multi-copper enzyme maturation permease subunit